MLRIYDTAIGAVVDFEPRDPGRVSIYACGPTVYDVPHIGHGRMVLVFDLLRRYLEWSGYEVTFVSNVTDIDDNIIKRAVEEGRTTEEVVATYEKAWWDAIEGLGVKRPTEEPHATAFVARMVELIQDLFARGYAYVVEGDGVYFRAERVDGYGLLARQSLDSLRSGARVEVAEGKESAVDFALWKFSKPGEPVWPSPWGDGRPGWHTECVVMSLDILGDGFDIHGGGRDLAFPHHENERAQALASGRSFARHWMHNGWVAVEGVKMSKSLKNFTSLTDLLEQTGDGRTYRLLVLQSHYRSPIEVTPDTIDRAARSLARLDAFGRRFASAAGTPADPDAVARFRAAMDDDLNSPVAAALIFDLVGQANTAADAGDEAAARPLAAAAVELAAALGLPIRTGEAEVDDDTAALVRQRDEARAARDFGRADALRDELVARGWTVEDTAAGTRVHR